MAKGVRSFFVPNSVQNSPIESTSKCNMNNNVCKTLSLALRIWVSSWYSINSIDCTAKPQRSFSRKCRKIPKSLPWDTIASHCLSWRKRKECVLLHHVCTQETQPFVGSGAMYQCLHPRRVRLWRSGGSRKRAESPTSLGQRNRYIDPAWWTNRPVPLTLWPSPRPILHLLHPGPSFYNRQRVAHHVRPAAMFHLFRRDLLIAFVRPKVGAERERHKRVRSKK